VHTSDERITKQEKRILHFCFTLMTNLNKYHETKACYKNILHEQFIRGASNK